MNIIATLDTIMQIHTKHYQNDFDSDSKIIMRAAQSNNPEDKNLLWMSRPSGTWCFKEQDVFIKDTMPFNTWVFYGEQTRDKILAYAVEITGLQDGKVRGNLYELDYSKHFQHVKNNALPRDKVVITFKDGESQAFSYKAGQPFPYTEKPIASGHYEPADVAAWRSIVQNEQSIRKQTARAGNYLTHVTALDKAEARESVTQKLKTAKQAVKPPAAGKSHPKKEPEL